MKVLGIKCSKTELGWVVLEGTSRSDAAVVAYDQAKAGTVTLVSVGDLGGFVG